MKDLKIEFSFVSVLNCDPFIMCDLNEFVNRVVENGGNDKVNIIGSAIKKRRTDLHLTLSETANDICCYSTLSKIERNIDSSANELFISKICEKINLNYDELSKIEPTKLIHVVYQYYMNNQIEEIHNLVSHFQTVIYVPSEELCKAFYALLTRDFALFSNIMKGINDIKNTLTTDEVIMMLFVMAVYSSLTSQMNKCLKYIGLIRQFELKDNYLRALVQEMAFQSMVELNSSSYRYEFLKLKGFYEINIPLDVQMKNDFLLKVVEPTLENLEKLEKINLEFIYDSCKEDYFYTVSYLKLMNNQVFEGLDLIKQFNTPKFVALYGLGVVLLSKMNTSKKVLKEYKSYFNEMVNGMEQKQGEELHLSFIELMNVELTTDDPKMICDFIKNVFLVNIKTYQSIIYKKYLDVRYLPLLGGLSRYKDAYNYAIECQNVLKDSNFYCIMNKITNK